MALGWVDGCPRGNEEERANLETAENVVAPVKLKGRAGGRYRVRFGGGLGGSAGALRLEEGGRDGVGWGLGVDWGDGRRRHRV